MPELSRFGGIIIYLYFYDIVQHNMPHIHVKYGEYEAVITLSGELKSGSLPQKQFKIVLGWLAYHEEEIQSAWDNAVVGKHFDKVPPM